MTVVVVEISHGLLGWLQAKRNHILSPAVTNQTPTYPPTRGLTGRRKNDEWLRLFDVVIVGCGKVTNLGLKLHPLSSST
jgi:hypothetical protein